MADEEQQGADAPDRAAQWLADDIHDYDGEEGAGWRLKVDTSTMEVLVCMRGVPCPFTGYPDELPGQLLIEGERWVSELVAIVTLYVLDRNDGITELYLDTCAARYLALEWVRGRDQQLREMEQAARALYKDALKGRPEKPRPKPAQA